MHSTTTTYLILSLLPLLQPAAAWGSLGHRTVAYLASTYFTPESVRMTNHLLNGQDISEAALFPDKVRHMPQFAYTRGWHYIDAQDSPPSQCGINMTRDCIALDGGCVVSAIANHTSRVGDASLPHYLRGQSLRFMMHFFGDVHQPLHTEAEDRGGNEYIVRFDGHPTNLHSVWDTLIPNKYAGMSHGDDEFAAAWLWAQRLSDNGDEPLEGECLHDAADCALSWAGEANSYVCSYVLAHDVHNQDLGGNYYDGAIPVTNDLIQKAGRRLAAWINSISADYTPSHASHADGFDVDHDAMLQTQ
ncbi:uncharacterized protein Z520_03629 [Fonsecaea multimorphosa CBS 102226]|uniref:Nuclease S1 n=1 Tax=Fonsecaea multimorphosa CBS 102226 TaxID=1442371 RepID=A0A0D2K5A3_9EURO|nr:uncharacterized protein Z520_03629 [Fonsecaea multimorphosa CBS 102226]KIY00963.1 hypothetical protein Z520_03629 [Fonsecaea multimorphosa CBS 102226]OAL27547.1 hypothetical protein AYO22_03451 [Fonsecaea multimorphosa]